MRYLQRLAYPVLVLGVLKIGYELFWMLAYQERWYLHSDVLIYLTVGRGILNGQRIYADLFESKPPLIFLLSAASLWMTKGTLLMRVLQAINLLGLPVFLAAASWMRDRDAFRAGLAAAFGGLLALWAQRNAGALQTETFGLLPVTLYACTLAFPGWSRKRTVVSAIAIGLAVWLREPYGIGLFAAVILSGKPLGKAFILPLGMAALAGVLLLLFLGVAQDYLGVYLPGMLEGRIQAGHIEPLYLRALWVQRLWSSLTTYSPMPLLGPCVAALWLFAVARGAIRPLLGVVATLAGAVGMGQYFVLFGLLLKTSALGLRPWDVLTDAGFWPISFLYLAGTVSYLSLAVWLWRTDRGTSIRVATALALLALVSLGIGIGGYGRNYQLFLLAPVLVLVLSFLGDRQNPVLPLLFSALVGVMCLTYRHPEVLDPKPRYLQEDTARRSAGLDALMDACGYSTFIFDGASLLPAFSKYSPVGPLFQLGFHSYLGPGHPLYARTYRHMADAPLIVREVTDDRMTLPESIEAAFTLTPPPCAEGLTVTGYQFLFRHSGTEAGRAGWTASGDRL